MRERKADNQRFSQDKPGNCENCPYGRCSPCIGYCLLKILQEMRRKRETSAKKEGDCYAG